HGPYASCLLATHPAHGLSRAAMLAPGMQKPTLMHSALTDRTYWDHVWSFTADHQEEAQVVATEHDSHQAHLAELFRRHLPPGGRFLEIGAGGSPWPAHVAACGGDA